MAATSYAPIAPISPIAPITAVPPVAPVAHTAAAVVPGVPPGFEANMVMDWDCNEGVETYFDFTVMAGGERTQNTQQAMLSALAAISNVNMLGYGLARMAFNDRTREDPFFGAPAPPEVPEESEEARQAAKLAAMQLNFGNQGNGGGGQNGW